MAGLYGRLRGTLWEPEEEREASRSSREHERRIRAEGFRNLSSPRGAAAGRCAATERRGGSVNPIMFTATVLLILAWKVAGFYGVDRVVLPLLRTPWELGPTFHGTARERHQGAT